MAARFLRTPGDAGQQSLPCVKGGGVRKDDGGIDAEQFTFCSANSNCSMSKNPATHNRKPHVETNRWGTIPKPRRRKVRELRFRLWAKSSVHFLLPEGNPLGGLLLSPPNPLRWASAGTPMGGFGEEAFSPPLKGGMGDSPEG